MFEDLLSAGDHAEIRAAFTDIHATFNKTAILYKVFIENTIDRFNEDRQGSEFTSYNLMAQVEYGNYFENDRYLEDSSGKAENTTTKIILNVDYLKTFNLWDDVNNLVKFNGAKDKLFIKGEEYDISQVTYDGKFNDKPIMVVVFADPKQQET